MIGILAAHRVELRPVTRRLQTPRRYQGIVYGRLRGVSVAAVRVGQGWARAQQSATRLFDFAQCVGLVITGFVGATHADWSVGDLVIPDLVLDLHQDDDAPGGPQYRPPLRLQELRERVSGRGGVLGTVGDLLVDPWEKEQCGQRTGVVAVDLESAAIAAVAQLRGVPWVIARVVLDPMERPLGVVSWWHAAVLAVSVTGWGRLWRFGMDLTVAQRRLGEGVGIVVEELHQLLLKRGDAPR